MAVRIDEYGHIHITGDGTPSSAENEISSPPPLHTRHTRRTTRQEYHDVLGHHTAWYEHDNVFWVITLSFAGVISWLAWILYTSAIMPSLMVNSSEFPSDIQNFFADKAPFVFVIGAFCGVFNANMSAAASHHINTHTPDDYMYSFLFAFLGILGGGLIWFLLFLGIVIILVILAIIFVAGAIAGGMSGG